MADSTQTPVIELRDITKIYKTGDEDTVALNKITLHINRGEFMAIMGPSGSGKSTLMHILGLLDKPSKGTYLLDGRDIKKQSKGKLAQVRNRKIGFIFQQFNLLPRTKVLDNILLPTVYGNLKNRYDRAEMLLKQVGLEDRVDHLSNQLSGGQIQRVAIARALIMAPSLILADEPTGNLDTKRSHEIMELLKQVNNAGATIVLITHEKEVANYAKRILHVQDGQIIHEEHTR